MRKLAFAIIVIVLIALYFGLWPKARAQEAKPGFGTVIEFSVTHDSACSSDRLLSAIEAAREFVPDGNDRLGAKRTSAAVETFNQVYKECVRK